MSEPNYSNYSATTESLLQEDDDVILLGPFKRTSTPILSRRGATTNKRKETMSDYETFSAGLHSPPSVAEVHRALFVSSRGIITGQFLCHPKEEEKSSQILVKKSYYKTIGFAKTEKKNTSFSRDSKKISTCVLKKIKASNFILEEKHRHQPSRCTSIKGRFSKVKSNKGMLKNNVEEKWPEGIQKDTEYEETMKTATLLTSRVKQRHFETTDLVKTLNCEVTKGTCFVVPPTRVSIRSTTLKRSSCKDIPKKNQRSACEIWLEGIQNFTEEERLDEIRMILNEHSVLCMTEEALKTTNPTKTKHYGLVSNGVDITNDEFKDSYSHSFANTINSHKRKHASLLEKLCQLIFGKNKSYTPNCKRSCKKYKCKYEDAVNGYINFQDNFYNCKLTK